jgi:alpha-glucosidase
MGADAIYLTPIQPAPSNHKYDADSYIGVDENLGGDEAFQRLVECTRQAKMGLIMDGVFNHVGYRHQWAVEAREKRGRQNWFRPHPDNPETPCCWRGSRNLPELDTENPEVINALLYSDSGPFQYWSARGVTGWRLDCANDLGMDFCRIVTSLARQIRASTGGLDDGVIGEVMAFAAQWTARGTLDGVMNYWFRETVLGLLTGQISPAMAREAFLIAFRSFSLAGLLRSWNMLSSHDTPRLAHLLPRESQRRVAFAMQYFLPGVPLLYYGEELGMQGGPDPDNRRPMDWSALDPGATEPPLVSYLRQLAQIRSENPVLREGGVRPCIADAASGLLAFLRYNARNFTDFAVLIINPTDEPTPANTLVFVPSEGMFDGLPLVNQIPGNSPDIVTAKSGTLQVRHFPPMSAALYLPAPNTISGYSFHKPCYRKSSVNQLSRRNRT